MSIVIEFRNKGERKAWDVLDPTIPDFTTLGRSHFDIARKGQTKMLLFSMINVFQITFGLRKVEKRNTIEFPRVETQRNIGLHFDPKRSI